MSISSKTIAVLEDEKRCEAVVAALLLDYNKEFIKRRFKITRQQLNHIMDAYLENENERLQPDDIQGQTNG